jgi:hypothetical protein
MKTKAFSILVFLAACSHNAEDQSIKGSGPLASLNPVAPSASEISDKISIDSVRQLIVVKMDDTEDDSRRSILIEFAKILSDYRERELQLADATLFAYRWSTLLSLQSSSATTRSAIIEDRTPGLRTPGGQEEPLERIIGEKSIDENEKEEFLEELVSKSRSGDSIDRNDGSAHRTDADVPMDNTVGSDILDIVARAELDEAAELIILLKDQYEARQFDIEYQTSQDLDLEIERIKGTPEFTSQSFGCLRDIELCKNTGYRWLDCQLVMIVCFIEVMF